MRFLRFSKWLNDLYDLTHPWDLVVYERAHHRGGYATELGVGLQTRVQEFAAARDIEYVAVHSATLKKHATGHGRASKQDMMDAYRALRGCDPIDDNEADAFLLLEYAKREFKG
jgi:Holliday junction resolvasome RuvABC endonuclease subunit